MKGFLAAILLVLLAQLYVQTRVIDYGGLLFVGVVVATALLVWIVGDWEK